MRDKKATRRRLSDEQEMALSGVIGLMLVDKPGETHSDTWIRLFGTIERAREAWFDHRARLVAEFPRAGERGPAWWELERGREAPDLDEQPAALRELGELSDDEERELAEDEASRHRPEMPTDLGIGDVTAIDPIDHPPEVPHDDAIDATPGEARPEVTPTQADDRADTAISEEPAEDPVEERAPETIVSRPPRILPIRRGIDDRKPRSLTGWESHDA